MTRRRASSTRSKKRNTYASKRNASPSPRVSHLPREAARAGDKRARGMLARAETIRAVAGVAIDAQECEPLRDASGLSSEAISHRLHSRRNLIHSRRSMRHRACRDLLIVATRVISIQMKNFL